MKRWWMWVLTGAGVLVAAFAVLLLIPKAPPFKFLRGIELASSSPDPEIGCEIHNYLVRTDYHDLARVAGKELVAAGFGWEDAGTPEQTYYGRADESFVSLYANTRVVRGLPVSEDMGASKGWITVIVAEPEGKGTFERFREWIGL